MRISDWSSDVCSSDLQGDILARNEAAYRAVIGGRGEYAIQRWEQRGRPVIRFRRLLLPLASDRRRIDGVLGFALYDLLPDHDGKPIDHIHDPVTIVPEQETILDMNLPDKVRGVIRSEDNTI